jgi:hypothetical protein
VAILSSEEFDAATVDPFSVCFGSFRGCPMYHRINNELHRRHSAARLLEAFTTPVKPVTPVIAITHHGRAVPLRPTGT